MTGTIFFFNFRLSFLKPLEGLCDNDERKFLYFGALTNLVAPINVHNPHWNYYHWTNFKTTLKQL